MSTLLTPHFTLEEFTHSPTAVRLGLGNTPPPGAVDALRALCVHVLEPLRAHVGRPVRVLSGYRGDALNVRVGGAPSSQHTTGEAVDVRVDGVPAVEVARWCLDNTDADQVILEFPGPDEWCHLSYRRPPAPNRNQALTAGRVNGKVRYVPGLHPLAAP